MWFLLVSTLEPLNLKEANATKNGKLHLVCLLVLFHHFLLTHGGVLVPPLHHHICFSLMEHPQQTIVVLEIVEGQQAEMEECIGRGGMGQDQNGHTIIKEGNFRTTIIDLKELSLQDLNSGDLGFRATIGPVLQFSNLQ